MSEEEFYRFIQRMEKELYGNSSYLFAGETSLRTLGKRRGGK